MKTKLKERTYKWKEIYKILRKRIESGSYKKGEAPFAINKICEQFNVSTITARRVVDELERDGLIIKRQRVGAIITGGKKEKVYFLFNPPALNQHHERERISWILIRILKGMIEESQRSNLELTYIHKSSISNLDKEKVLLLEYSSIGKDKLIQLKDEARNIITIHSPERIEGTHTIREGLFKGVFLATTHLVECGYRKIGFISGPLDETWFITRLQGYLEGLKIGEVDFSPNLLKVTNSGIPEEDERAIEELLEEGIDSVICSNDIRAINVLEYCAKKNIKVPDDLAVCGFDDIEEAKDYDLTTVNTHLEKIGEKAIELAAKIIEGKVKETVDIIIEPELIIRKTTKKTAEIKSPN